MSPFPSGSSDPGGVEEGGQSVTGYYGCFSGACVPINWDPSRPGPECDPHFQNSTCYSQCSSLELECEEWK